MSGSHHQHHRPCSASHVNRALHFVLRSCPSLDIVSCSCRDVLPILCRASRGIQIQSSDAASVLPASAAFSPPPASLRALLCCAVLCSSEIDSSLHVGPPEQTKTPPETDKDACLSPPGPQSRLSFVSGHASITTTGPFRRGRSPLGVRSRVVRAPTASHQQPPRVSPVMAF